jgi:hypothetical protein
MAELISTEVFHIHARILALETEHGDLDSMIEHLVNTGYQNELGLKRMKKRKLALKDEIMRLKMTLMPDIPA